MTIIRRASCCVCSSGSWCSCYRAGAGRGCINFTVAMSSRPLPRRGLCGEVTAYAGGFCHAEDIVQLLRLGAIATGSELPGEADGVCRG